MIDPHEIVVAVRLNGLADFLHQRSDLLPDDSNVSAQAVLEKLNTRYPLLDHYCWAVTWSDAFDAYLVGLCDDPAGHITVSTCILDREANARPLSTGWLKVDQ